MKALRGPRTRISRRTARLATSSSTPQAAPYTFSKTGRTVCNVIDAEFQFRDGLIVRHTDRFDLWRWAGSALGAKGMLLGWAPPVHNAIRQEAMRALAAWRARQAP